MRLGAAVEKCVLSKEPVRERQTDGRTDGHDT